MATRKTMDGNEAAAYASYAFTEVAAIFPITPSSPMAELVDEWAAHGKHNLFGQPVRVIEMQSEAGAAGAVHGALQGGALTTTYTASQGLLLMIPNMYKIAGELLPGVFHVSARALASHALSIFGDHQDVMAVRQTGFALLAAANVQEAMDLGFVAHLSAIKARVPFLHFFDGFRTSHEIQKIELLDYADVAKITDWQAVQAFRDRALNPEHPVLRGSAQNPDIYFQGREAANTFYAQVPDTVDNYMSKIGQISGREYHPFVYYGSKDAERIIVAMGSVCDTIEESVDHLVTKGEKVGLVKVHLYRPFAPGYFFRVFPDTVKRIAVLDRTKEPGALGEPLYLDVNNLFYKYENKPVVVGGRYGLGSKEVTPSQIAAVFKNLAKDAPKDHFTLGINDDVTHTSLREDEAIETTPVGTVSCKFWGLGSDGTVGANKEAIKIIGDNTDLHVQAYFQYDSKKSGGATISHLRFGKHPIRSPYLVASADYIACHNPAYVYQFDLLKGLKENGTFVLNCPWRLEELGEKLPPSMKAYIARHKANFYVIDAVSIAQQVGLGGRINMIMQAVFFHLSHAVPVEEAIGYLKASVQKAYSKKGLQVVTMNHNAIDKGIEALVKVDIPTAWVDVVANESVNKREPEFIANVLRPMVRLEGDTLPVSSFVGREDGTFPLGTSAFEKRGIAVSVPEWQTDKCTQCNQCAYVCPHAAIRPLLLDEEEIKGAPAAFATKQSTGKGLRDFQFRIQVSPLDCTGCGNCVEICPAREKALLMKPAVEQDNEVNNWEYAMLVKDKNLANLHTVKNTQFVRPLLEFSGACPGCGETPYVKLLTQLFGDRMVIANATGCSSIWGGSAPSIPYTVNAEGKGPAWANSLFEDNAEFGLGMYFGAKQNRERMVDLIKQALELPVQPELREACQEWLDGFNDPKIAKAAAARIETLLTGEVSSTGTLAEILRHKDYLAKRSHWIIGGDGWAYDIGYGGLDHVLASGEDVNILVLDTEVYSNTGGQASKATPAAAVAKFQAAGKRIKKKDLGMMAMSYGYVYVAQICLGADMAQTLKAIQEAESYPGPSLIVAYAPCINHGIKAGMEKSITEGKNAVQAGYWHLYRYNPVLAQDGKNPFVLDSKQPTASFKDFILGEVRYGSLMATFPEMADELFAQAEKYAQLRFEGYKRLAE
ncbi:pyruvate-flavodoxin oxidoreductase [Peptococcaceae bacterium CEB3]|nr:pyruvate-flavodoxin oxidoreductase [Peptococcaceae bacterium CEB3]